jgi:hypothetical protein
MSAIESATQAEEISMFLDHPLSDVVNSVLAPLVDDMQSVARALQQCCIEFCTTPVRDWRRCISEQPAAVRTVLKREKYLIAMYCEPFIEANEVPLLDYGESDVSVLRRVVTVSFPAWKKLAIKTRYGDVLEVRQGLTGKVLVQREGKTVFNIFQHFLDVTPETEIRWFQERQNQLIVHNAATYRAFWRSYFRSAYLERCSFTAWRLLKTDGEKAEKVLKEA